MNQFEKKFVNEMWTMPLGSLLNAYGQINQGKGITASKLIEETQLLEDYAKKIVKVYHDEDIRAKKIVKVYHDEDIRPL